jgi:hypothetical protein
VDNSTNFESEIQIPEKAIVLELKSTFLRKIGETSISPRMLRFSFWECELRDDIFFMSYQIPQRSEISVSSPESLSVSVVWKDESRRTYHVWIKTHVSALRHLVSRDIGIPESHFWIFNGDSEVREDDSLCDHDQTVFTVVTHPHFRFSTATDPIELRLYSNAKVSDAIAEFSRRLCLSPDRIHILSSGLVITDSSALLSSFSNLGITTAIPVTFSFEGSEFSEIRI